MSQLRKSSSAASHIRKINKINHLRERVSLEIASHCRSITCGGQAALDDVRNSFVSDDMSARATPVGQPLETTGRRLARGADIAACDGSTHSALRFVASRCEDFAPNRTYKCAARRRRRLIGETRKQSERVRAHNRVSARPSPVILPSVDLDRAPDSRGRPTRGYSERRPAGA